MISSTANPIGALMMKSIHIVLGDGRGYLDIASHVSGRRLELPLLVLLFVQGTCHSIRNSATFVLTSSVASFVL